jgi:alkyl hydroperoxide reductase subunit AhpC
LLSDFELKGKVAKIYGVYSKQDGICERTLFVIDKDGIIHWSFISHVGINQGAAGIPKALKSIDNHQPEQAQEQEQKEGNGDGMRNRNK